MGILILLPPPWLINFAKNNIAISPTIDTYLFETEKESEYLKKSSQQVEVSERELKGFLKQVSIKYGTDYEEMSAVINCESGWKTDLYSWNKSSYGIAQYTPATFEENCQGDYGNPFAQLECMGLMFKKGMQSRWDCWKMLN